MANSLARVKEEYIKLRNLIATRQTFEHAHSEKPYSNHPTMSTFPNIDGWCLLQLAVRIGDLDEVKRLIEVDGLNVSQQMPLYNATALKIAFIFGHKEIVNYLLAKGASILECDRDDITDTDCLAIYDNEAKQLLKNRDQTLCYDAEVPNSKKTYADLAAEIGDETYFITSRLETIEFFDMSMALNEKMSPLHRAVANNQQKIIRLLLDNKIEKDATNEYGNTILHTAIQTKNLECVKLLLGYDVNINHHSLSGPPLYLAISLGETAIVKELLSRGADPFVKTYIDETIFHAQAQNGMDLSGLLPNTSEIELLKQSKNIYGQTPDDYLQKNLTRSINQGKLIKKIGYFLDLNYRNKEFFSPNGYCNGLTFLYHYYDSINQLDVFYKILNTISSWDGSEKQLHELFPSSLDDCKNLDELLETFLSHLTLFHSKWRYKGYEQQKDDEAEEEKIEQKDRKKQLAIVDKQINFIIPYTDFFATQKQLSELLTILCGLPQGTHIEFGGSHHATGAKILPEKKYSYFDTNFRAILDRSYESQILANLIIRTKHEMLQQPVWQAEKYGIGFMAYHFPWEQHIDANFNYYAALPKNKEEACVMEFPENKFTPLHIAILTNSMDNLKKLIQDDYCDANQQDAHERSPLDLAYLYKNEIALNILLKNCKQVLDCSRLMN
ncbi:MAG: hypothetical protein A3F11_05240 [Gammaproteobacteria bacterium RIFCSPHIGHO2_12_FULL_37_14]|nr:MAG: hypothetical protein A3F11_05240 [Gammaproteobacteria bacterium RIFCSPHIGHO2_12_FULL_37_14]